jgi:hypothetical protein
MVWRGVHRTGRVFEAVASCLRPARKQARVYIWREGPIRKGERGAGGGWRDDRGAGVRRAASRGVVLHQVR